MYKTLRVFAVSTCNHSLLSLNCFRKDTKFNKRPRLIRKIKKKKKETRKEDI